MDKIALTLSLLCFTITIGISQYTYVYFHNNTSLNLTATTTGNAHTDDWTGYDGAIIPQQPKVELMNFFRSYIGSSSSNGSYNLTTNLAFPSGESVDVQIEYNVNWTATITFRHSADGTTFTNHPWRNDGTVYEENTFTVDGKDYILRYESYFTGGYDDVYYSIYEADDTPYTVTATDLTNPEIFNLMSYNVFMRPTALFPTDDQATRADHIADYVHDMDAIILQEVFDNTTRATLLSNLATEYPHQTTVVDDTGNALEDGGVLIVSRWPIEVEDQYLWGSECFEDDCVSNKGVKYARINKLGVKYHVFGTHMDAFNKDEDVAVRKAQLVSWKSYIDSKSIPATEAVLMGGDYNIDKFANKFGEYDSLWGNFAAEEPIYAGFPSTWDPTFNLYNFGEPYDPEFLDYVLSQGEHLNAATKVNTSLIMRSNHIDMWRIFDLSDHYPIWGRFEFPIPTPVELLSLRGWFDENEELVKLAWKTATEINNKEFVIEKSIDREIFEEIARVEGHGNSQEVLDYSYDDKDASSGFVYYRLRQIDYDGTESLSDIVSVYVPGERISIKSIYPNPVTSGNLTLEYTASGDISLFGTIQNITGQVVENIQVESYEGENSIDFNTNNWAKGVYVLRLMDDSGKVAITEKIIKQ